MVLVYLPDSANVYGSKDRDDDDDDESIGYVRPLLQLKTVASVLREFVWG